MGGRLYDSCGSYAFLVGNGIWILVLHMDTCVTYGSRIIEKGMAINMRQKIMEVKNLTFSYNGEGHALDGISLSIYAGERIAVLGENGAGKSTFFLNMNGVREPDGGEIFLYGKKLCRKNRNRLREKVGIVFQDADSQMIASTVKAEVAFGPLNMKLPREEVERRANRAIGRLGLEAYTERPPHYLSGGEKKRVSIADILAMDTEIIIFDEPTVSLDPIHAQLLEKILKELGQEGKTILLSTHDVDFAYRFAERILVFHEGKVIGDGTADDIFKDGALLEKANLIRPLLMQVSALLRKKGMLEDGGEEPKSLCELENLL